jgi:septum formation protein
METIILASGSPRRKEILTRLKMPVKVVPPDIHEDYSVQTGVADNVARIARSKVDAVLALFRSESPRWVLGVDTVVEIDGTVLGKPSGPEEAESMLRALSGRTHRVFSGVALQVERGRDVEEDVVCTEVKFRDLALEDVKYYVETGEWAGAAGGYRIQERGAFLVELIHGSYTNVVGLPLESFYVMLKRNGYSF